MANTVSTRIIARDDATKVFNNLGNSIRNNTAAGLLMGQGISAAVGLATSAVTGLVGAFGDAAALQSEAIGTAGDFAKMTGMSFAEAQGQITGFNERMSKSAAALPGATKDYTALGRGIMDNLIPAFQDVNGALDADKFNETLDSITTSGALRAANAGVEAKDAALAISKALSGKSIAELSTLRFFENSPASLAFLQKESEKIGTDLKSMTAKQRAEVVQAALAVPDEVINASKVSVSGLIEGYKSSLFDPSTGVFGLMRKLGDGGSAFSVAGQTVALIFGPTGLVSKAGAILSSLGLTSDPMEMLAGGLTWVNNHLKKVGFFLNAFKSKLDTGRLDASSFSLGDIPSKVGKAIAALTNKAFSSLGSMDSTAVGQKIGNMLAKAIDALTGFVANINLAAVGMGIINVGMTLAAALVQTVRALDWGQFMQALGVMGVAAAVAMSGSILAGTSTAAATVMAAIASTGPMAMAAITAAAALGTATIMAIGQKLVGWITSLGNAIGDMLSRAKDSVINAVTFGRAGNSSSEPVGNNASGLDQGGLFAAIARERAAMPTGAKILIANDSEAILNRRQQSQALGALNNNRGQQSKALGGNFTVGNLTINAGAVTDPEQLAQLVMQKIGEQYARYGQSKMTPAF